jgi:glycosyltransferase 2 family protein
MKNKLEYLWPVVGLAAVVFSIYLLSKELKGVEVGQVWQAVVDRGPLMFLCAFGSTLLAYAALAWYDRIALMHVGKKLSWPIVSVVSFTAYALGHNIGVSVLSSGLVRYRAYSKMGLNVGEVAIVTAFCAFTFAYGAIFLGGIVLTGEPGLLSRLFNFPVGVAFSIGLAMLSFVALYQIGAILKFKPLRIRSFEIAYPKPGIAFRQLFAAPLEIIGAAGIIYFALPDSLNPGFFIVLGMFLASFCAGLISNAPGGAGVFEIVFFMIMLPGGTSPDDPAAAHTKAQILAALLVFRLLYLLIPLAISCAIVLYTERQAFAGLLGSVLGGKNGVETEPVPVETGRQDPPKQ